MLIVLCGSKASETSDLFKALVAVKGYTPIQHIERGTGNGDETETLEYKVVSPEKFDEMCADFDFCQGVADNVGAIKLDSDTKNDLSWDLKNNIGVLSSDLDAMDPSKIYVVTLDESTAQNLRYYINSKEDDQNDPVIKELKEKLDGPISKCTREEAIEEIKLKKFELGLGFLEASELQEEPSESEINGAIKQVEEDRKKERERLKSLDYSVNMYKCYICKVGGKSDTSRKKDYEYFCSNVLEKDLPYSAQLLENHLSRHLEERLYNGKRGYNGDKIIERLFPTLRPQKGESDDYVHPSKETIIENNKSMIRDGVVGFLVSKFCEEHDLEYFNIGFYHGTDKYVWEMDDKKRQRYHDALFKYVCACAENDGLCSKLDEKEKKRVLSQAEVVTNRSKGYKYESMYVTTSLETALNYSKRANFLGELGELAYKLKGKAIKYDINVDLDPDTTDTINEWYEEFKGRENEIQPIIFKLKPEAVRKIYYTEVTEYIFNEALELDFKEKYLTHALELGIMDFAKLKERKDKRGGYPDGVVWPVPDYISFSMDDTVTKECFTVLAAEDGQLDQGIEQSVENANRVVKDYYDFVDRFCAENEALIQSENGVMKLQLKHNSEELLNPKKYERLSGS